jgi:four helix bundle protein
MYGKGPWPMTVTVIDAAEGGTTDRMHYRLAEQIEACSTSIAMNIAEGKDRHSKKEFRHSFFIYQEGLYMKPSPYWKFFIEKAG